MGRGGAEHLLIIVPSLRAHFCIVVAVTVDCSYAIVLMIYRRGKESLLVLDEKAHCSIVLFSNYIFKNRLIKLKMKEHTWD